MDSIINVAVANILRIIIAAVLALVAGYLLPQLGVLIKSKIIDRLVAAAEQKITGSKMGAERKEYVLSQLALLKIKVTEAVDDLIEASVYNLNAAKKHLETGDDERGISK